MSVAETTYPGQCLCGAVTIEVTGEPAAAGYCHCKNCRSWSAGPVNAFTLWKPESVKVTKGKTRSTSSQQRADGLRLWCKSAAVI